MSARTPGTRDRVLDIAFAVFLVLVFVVLLTRGQVLYWTGIL
ncbi:hypothetical protein GCM10009613_18630 [Pseudonocardia kongjuensis]|uniref:Uncharacterized protein n=1 Tax=Pseudonocardia kongjuensis TaxID=102227 RepID=A0ABP4IES9_9PSEU